MKESPGPCYYNPKSNFQQSASQLFSKYKRDTMHLNKTALENPGPGVYLSIAEFGMPPIIKAPKSASVGKRILKKII